MNNFSIHISKNKLFNCIVYVALRQENTVKSMDSKFYTLDKIIACYQKESLIGVSQCKLSVGLYRVFIINGTKLD